MCPKANSKQIQEFGNNMVNNTINKLIALHFTTSSKFFKMLESLWGLKSLQTLKFWINLAFNLPRMDHGWAMHPCIIDEEGHKSIFFTRFPQKWNIIVIPSEWGCLF